MSDTQKHNKPNVPNLRFPGFCEEWEKHRIGELCSFFSGGTPSSSKKEYYGGKISFIRSGEIHSDDTELFLSEEGYKNSSAKMVEVGDILLALYGANSGDIAISKIHGAINQAILCIRTNMVSVFFKSVWEKHTQKILDTYLQGGQGNLSAEIVKKIFIHLPAYDEQLKLAAFISKLEERIAIQNKVIEKYETLINAIIQQALKRTTNRYYLSKVLTERKELNSKGFEISSVSVSNGVINQVEYLGRSFAAKETNHYHVVRYGDIVYTKSPTGDFPYGIIKQSYCKNPVAVSPLYGVYEPITYEVGVFLHHYFGSPKNALNYLHPLIQKGAKNTINITNQHFLDNKISIPEGATLAMTVKAINIIAEKNEIEQRLLIQYQLLKSFFLSSMLI